MLGVVAVRVWGEGHFEETGCAAPFGFHGVVAFGFGVDFEAAEAGVEFPGAFAEAGVVVGVARGPEGAG
jgi:hypothetical protein